jgi:hypothetical protein
MKKLLISLVVFSVLFIIGCQENSITDPVSTESINKNQTTGETAMRSIPLEGILVVPGGFQTYYDIQGQINYTDELVQRDPMPPVQQDYINLHLYVNAVLTNTFESGRNTFTISSESQDVIYVSEDGIYMLEKSFPILGRTDGLVLVCRFLVTTDGVGLNAKWLSFSDVRTNKSSLSGDTIMPPVRINNFQ